MGYVYRALIIYRVDTFPDPVPNEIDGILHYKEGVDPEEKYLPSILENVEKSPHGIPFSPTAQMAKNVGFVITCLECEKPRLLHSEYVGSGNDKDERHLRSMYVKT